MNENSNEVKSRANPRNESKRRSLQSIQPISSNNKVLTRSMSTNKRSDKEKQKQRSTQYLTQRDSIEKDVNYWKIMAKERDRALDIALKENEELSETNRRLNEKNEELGFENEILKAENKHLSDLAEEGIKLRDLVQQYID